MAATTMSCMFPSSTSLPFAGPCANPPRNLLGSDMAGDWLKFDKSTPDKPEVFEIASQLQIDPDSVVGKLMRVWSWFDSHTEDGNALRVTPALLDRCAGHVGFVAAMQSVGWMVIENGGCRLPKFDRHCGSTAKKRALGKNRTQKSRSSNDDSVTQSVTESSPEKRREEKKKEQDQKTRSSGDEHGPLFDQFWSAYPRKVAKKAAAKAFGKIKNITDVMPAILAAVARDAKSLDWQHSEVRFIPHPASWLNGERWLDGAPAANGAVIDNPLADLMSGAI